MTRQEIRAEVDRRFKAGSITAKEHADFMARMDKLDAKSALTASPIPTEVNALFDAVVNRLDYLAARWSDEKDYEDFAEYKAEATKLFPAPFKVKGVSQRPFSVTFTHPSDKRTFIIKVGRNISLSSK